MFFFNRLIKYLTNFADAEDKNQITARVIGFDTSILDCPMAAWMHSGDTK